MIRLEIIIWKLMETPAAVRYLDENHTQKVPTLKNHHFDILSSKIIELFPKESRETYYIPPKAEGSDRKIARGKLVDKCRNWLSSLSSVGLLTRKSKKNSEEIEEAAENYIMDSGTADMQKKFDERGSELLLTRKENSFPLSKLDYDNLVKEVKQMREDTYKKRPQDYQFLRRYDVAEIRSKEKLIAPVKEDDASLKLYVNAEELFLVLHDAHNSIGHGGRNRMKDLLNEKYKNVTKEMIMLYLNLCEIWQKNIMCQEKV